MKCKVNLNNLEKVNDFVNCMQGIPYKTYLYSGRYVVDAKSIVGIFSLDLSKPIELEVVVDEVFSKYMYNKIQPFLVSEGEEEEVVKYREKLTKMFESYTNLTSNIDKSVDKIHKNNAIFLEK